MSSWWYVAAGYVLTLLVLALVALRAERRIAALRRLLRHGGKQRSLGSGAGSRSA